MSQIPPKILLDQENPLAMFMYALKAPESKRQYPKRLKVFLDFLTSKNELIHSDLQNQCIEFMTKSQTDPKWANNKLMEFVLYQKERVYKNEIVYATIRNYLKTVKLFLEMNSDVPIVNWKRITKGLPSGKSAANDRAPTIEEIKKLVEYPDRRIKPIIYCMVSGGFRIGAWDYLKWKHITPLKNEEGEGEIIAAKVVIYSREPEEYYCFITPEAYDSLKAWIDYRSNAGEEITGESWLMRDLWQTTDFSYGAQWGLVKYPKQLKATGVKSLIERAMKAQRLAMPLQKGVKRREWKSGHGYRKVFKSRAEQVMRPANVELLSGRDIGVSGSYYKPTQKELLEDYLKAVDLLTINEDSKKLEKQFIELKEKSKDNEYIIRARLQEKESELEVMKQQIAKLAESQKEVLECLRNPEKLSLILRK
jgi:hypothetical protein